MKGRTGLLVVGMTLVGVTLAMAQPPIGGKAGQKARLGARESCGFQGAPGLEMLLRHEAELRELGVTEDQIQRLKDIAFTGRKQMIALQAEREQAELEIQQLFARDKLDREALNKAAERLGAVVTQIHKQRIQQRVDARELLGAQVLRQIRQQAGEKMRERRQQRPCPFGQKHRMDRPAAPEAPPPMEE